LIIFSIFDYVIIITNLDVQTPIKPNIMKIAVLILRSLLGLIFFAFGLMVLLHLMPVPTKADMVKMKMPEAAIDFQTFAGVYFMIFLKLVETISGIFLLINKYTSLILVIIFPVTLNIFLFHVFLEPSVLPLAIPMLLINLFLGYAYRKYYMPLFTASPTL
jgi:putative oxidoreductase